MKIVFCGSGSTGKSTLLKELQKDERFKDYIFFDSLTAQIKAQGYAINEKGDEETQKAIMSVHRDNLQYENFIASRSAIDCISYSLYLCNHGAVSKTVFDQLVKEYLDIIKHYDVIFYIKPEFKVEANGLRSTNQGFVDEVARNFDLFIIADNINVHQLHGTVEERMKQIYEVLDEQRN